MYVVYNVETGELLQTSDESIAISGHPLQTKSIDIPFPVDHNRYDWVPNIANFTEIRTVGLTKLEYMNRFTDVELASIYSAAKVHVGVEVWLAKFNATTPDARGYSVYTNDSKTIAGLNSLEQVGLIAAGRAAEILNG